MKVLIAYHSETGSNSRTAEGLFEKMREKKIDVRVLKVLPKKKFIKPLMGFSGLFEAKTKLKEDYNISEYDLVVFCGPVWASKYSPVLRGLIFSNDFNNKKCFLVSCCYTEAKNALKSMSDDLSSRKAEIVGSKPILVKNSKDKQKLADFAESIINECNLN